MRSVAFAVVVVAFAYWNRPYGNALSSIVGTHQQTTLVIAGIAAFLPPWLMGRAFMTNQEARRMTADSNSRPDYYDRDEQRMIRNSQDADPESIKVHFLLASLVAWCFQVFVFYKAFFYR